MTFLQQMGTAAALPEIILALSAMALLMYGVFSKDDPSDHVTMGAIGALAITAILVILGHEGRAFGDSFVVDTFAKVMKVLALFGSAVAIVLSVQFLKREKVGRFEYPVLMLLATTGMMMMISANSLIALYMGLELQSLALYVLAAINRDNARSSEAGLKYFMLGALSSGMLLYGASLVYGFTGSVRFEDIAATISAGSNLGLTFGLVFILAGIAFKISAVPFHMWTPDVYEGAPTPVAAFFASAPKLAAMALLTRVVMTPFIGITLQWQQIIVFISIASMALGAFAAIGQTNIKRLLAYSSIANIGFALVGLAAGSPEGVSSVITYMLIYVMMTLGSFACVIAMRRNGQQVENIADLAGLGRTNAGLAFVFAMLMFSLAGIPPLAGFFAKYFVFQAAVKAGLWTLAVLGVVLSVVGAYYYLRIIKIMYFDEPAPQFDRMDGEVKLVAYGSGAFVLLYVFFANPLLNLAQAAARVARPPLKLPGGAALLHFETIDSTNAEAHRLAAAPPELPLWIWADEQTQGRGRQGRHWVSERGNLFATYLCENQAPLDVLPQAALVAAVAARQALADIAPGIDVRIKWPNDILANGAKICGILCETVRQKPTLLALGFGMNIGHAPAASAYPVTSLAAEGVSVTVESVLHKLDVSLRESLTLWNEGRGFEGLRQAWLSHAAGLGGAARLSLGNKTESGIFRDLAPNGSLVLERQDGSRIEVISGEVWLEGVEALRRAKDSKVSA